MRHGEGWFGVGPSTGGARHRRHLLLLEPHLQWSVLRRCLGVDDLADALGVEAHGTSAEGLHLLVEASRLLRIDAAVCRVLQSRLDRRAQPWLDRAAACGGADALEALWERACDTGQGVGAYWAVLSHRDAGPALCLRVFEAFEGEDVLA